MACELNDCCQFFRDNMAEFPQAAEYIKKKLCFGDHQRCARYRIYKEAGCVERLSFYSPADEEEVAKISHCMRKKRGAAGDDAAES